MPLSVKVRNLSDASRLICTGQIIRGPESDHLYEVVTRQLQQEVILDLNGVTTIDEEGLFLIALCYEILSTSNRKLGLCNPPASIMAALRRRQLDRVFNLRESTAIH